MKVLQFYEVSTFFHISGFPEMGGHTPRSIALTPAAHHGGGGGGKQDWEKLAEMLKACVFPTPHIIIL